MKTYFIVHDDGDKCPTHTFSTYEKSNKYYWFEHLWKRFRGIHEYNFLKELLKDIKDKFIKYELCDNCVLENSSIGFILCSSKDEDVVEYSISKNMSQTMISEYKLKLIDKKLLETKLK